MASAWLHCTDAHRAAAEFPGLLDLIGEDLASSLDDDDDKNDGERFSDNAGAPTAADVWGCSERASGVAKGVN